MSTKAKGYVLDGIQTAMELEMVDMAAEWFSRLPSGSTFSPDDVPKGVRLTVSCPCGWDSVMRFATDSDASSALHFHFAWCPKARGED